MNMKRCFTIRGGEYRSIKSTARNRELFFGLIHCRNFLKTWDHTTNCLADCAGMRHFEPVYRPTGSEYSTSQLRDDFNFTSWTIVNSLLVPWRSPIRKPHITKHTLLSWGLRLFVAGKNRKNNCFASSEPTGMPRIQWCIHIHGHISATECSLRKTGIWACPIQISSKAKGEFHIPSLCCLKALERVKPSKRWQLHTKFRLEPFKYFLFQFWCNANRTHSLNIWVATNWLKASTRATNHASHEGKLRNGLYGSWTMKMMGHSHRPGKDSPLWRSVLFRNVVDLFLSNSRLFNNLIPWQLIKTLR